MQCMRESGSVRLLHVVNDVLVPAVVPYVRKAAHDGGGGGGSSAQQDELGPGAEDNE